MHKQLRNPESTYLLQLTREKGAAPFYAPWVEIEFDLTSKAWRMRLSGAGRGTALPARRGNKTPEARQECTPPRADTEVEMARLFFDCSFLPVTFVFRLLQNNGTPAMYGVRSCVYTFTVLVIHWRHGKRKRDSPYSWQYSLLLRMRPLRERIDNASDTARLFRMTDYTTKNERLQLLFWLLWIKNIPRPTFFLKVKRH